MIIFHPDCPPAEFDEKSYLDFNQDVLKAVQQGIFSSGWEHYYKNGFSENRPGISDQVKKLFEESLQDISLVPPDSLHDVGAGDYITVGNDIFGLLLMTGGLKPDYRILDVGCGTGRIARPLTKYVTSGTYDGFDIVKPSIDWCQKVYADLYPNFHFHFSDIYNKMYNPEGSCQAHEYRFPFKDESFDFIFLTSVFTHMLPLDMNNYLAEISRVLTREGTCFITFFLLNSGSIELIKNQMSDFSFQYELQGCRVEKQELPENTVAFAEDRIRELYQKYYLEIVEPIRYGSWSGRKNTLSYQDIIIAKKTC
jgi:ubiquinone/menaquinone biosynthesis C-methylase UbiE